MSARIADRWRCALALAFPSLSGLAYLAAFAAPARLVAVNGGALVIALAWVLMGHLPLRPQARLGLAASAAALLFLPPLLHLEVGGVSRWLPLYPFLLHSGFLLLPLVTVLAAHERAVGPILLALAAAALALQPDGGTLLALASACGALAWVHRSKAFALVAGASLALALATFDMGTLKPEIFTESVLPHVWRSEPLAALALGVALFVAPPALLVTGGTGPRPEGFAIAALLAGFGLAALIAPFPFPLIGYGASPILGFGLALGAAGTAYHR